LNYYIYYRVRPEQVEALRRSVETLFQKVEKQCGVRGRLMRRHDDPGTYMEVFEGVRDEHAFELLLAREASTFGFDRKVERFISAETPS
jgi:hypothetical protein